MPFRLLHPPSRWLIAVAVLVVATALAVVGVQGVTAPPTGGVEAASALPPGSALPSDAECAQRVERNPWEPRTANAEANQTVPPGPVPSRSWAGPSTDALQARVTGAFTGTTDEILQWASCKWGIDTDVVRAMAVQESQWLQSTRGDGGVSLGLLQIKSTYWHGTAPWSARSTAYNVDWSLGLWRACFEGLVHGAQARGDLWGCVGAHYSGFWLDPAGKQYIRWVQAHLDERDWLEWPSPPGGQPPTAER